MFWKIMMSLEFLFCFCSQQTITMFSDHPVVLETTQNYAVMNETSFTVGFSS